jgi:hypothetical protein
MWFILNNEHTAASFSKTLFYIYQSTWPYTPKDKYSKFRRFILPEKTLTTRTIKHLETNEMHARQPFFQILKSGGKKVTTVVIWGRSLEY